MIRTAPPGRHPLGARASRPHAVPLAAAELPAMPQAATLWASTPSARPKESHGAVPRCSKWETWPRPRQALCGRDARAPGQFPMRLRDWRSTSQKADVHPLANSLLPASPAPARGSSGAAKRRQHLAVGVSPWDCDSTPPLSRVRGDSTVLRPREANRITPTNTGVIRTPTRYTSSGLGMR